VNPNRRDATGLPYEELSSYLGLDPLTGGVGRGGKEKTSRLEQTSGEGGATP